MLNWSLDFFSFAMQNITTSSQPISNAPLALISTSAYIFPPSEEQNNATIHSMAHHFSSICFDSF